MAVTLRYWRYFPISFRLLLIPTNVLCVETYEARHLGPVQNHLSQMDLSMHRSIDIGRIPAAYGLHLGTSKAKPFRVYSTVGILTTQSTRNRFHSDLSA